MCPMDHERGREERVGFAQGFREVVRHVGVALLVGGGLATAFTLWTPASVLPRSAAREIARAMATRVGRSATPILPTVTPIARERIGIVAGHTENDSGAVCPDGLTEVEVNQNVAELVRVRLDEAGFDVDLLSEFDDRLEGYGALALVSIHADSCDYINDEATGFKVAGSLETQIPIESDRLSSCLIDRYSRATGLKFHAGSITYDMQYYHAYREIAPQTPAAIIEVGFMNLDRDILVNHVDVVADGVAEGVLCYARNERLGIE